MARAAKKARKQAQAVIGPVDYSTWTPLDWRRQHDPVEAVAEGEVVTDAQGGIGGARKVVDTLDVMVRCGSLTSGQEKAGRQFQDDFGYAHLDQLKANDMLQPLAGKGGTIGSYGRTIAEARDRVAGAIHMLGGVGSPAGRMAWEVLGEQRSIREHCERTILAPGRTLNRRTATAMLVDVCEALRLHYEIPEGNA